MKIARLRGRPLSRIGRMADQELQRFYDPWNKSLRQPWPLDRNDPRSVLMDSRERKSHPPIQFLPRHPKCVSMSLTITLEPERSITYRSNTVRAMHDHPLSRQLELGRQ
jgi:hypothetical protein